MISMPFVLRSFSTVVLRRFLDCFVHLSRPAHLISVFFLIAIVAVPLGGSAFAQQGFALLGTWQQTQKDSIQTVVFNPDGTFFGNMDVAPGAGGTGSGRTQWRGTYRVTGPSSWIARVEFWQMCASGGSCFSCPPSPGEMPGSNGCGVAQYMGLPVGVQLDSSWQMKGQNQCTDKYGQPWQRYR